MAGMRNHERADRRESGAALVEWALIVAAVAVVALTALALREVLEDVFLDSATKQGCVTMTDGTRVGELCND